MSDAETGEVPSWRTALPAEDRAIYDAAGYGRPIELGVRPALLVIDVNYGFTGSRAMPMQEALAEYRTSCGARSWQAVGAIQALLVQARAAQIPVLYSTGRDRTTGADLGPWGTKNRRAHEDLDQESKRSQIVAEIAPGPSDPVIRKTRPSAFFETDLSDELARREVDTLLCVGGTTSGCVRATVVDGFSLGFPIAVVEEGTFDRSELMHRVSLFDMNAKYANVISLQAAAEYCAGSLSSP